MFNHHLQEYRRVGKSGLRVSSVGFGNMINFRPENQEVDYAIFCKCLELGINFFDTAEAYSNGQSEKTLGNFIKKSKVHREEIVVSTKVWRVGKSINTIMTTNRKHIQESINDSLERLQLDYVDLLFAHRLDQNTPMQEICRGFNEAIEDGKALYWATSNWSAQNVYQAFSVCDKLGLHRPICDQMQYNLLVRKDMEVEYETLFDRYKYGSMAWSPLAGGYLTGKYLDQIPKNTRLSSQFYLPHDMMKKFYYQPHANQKIRKSLKQLQSVAKQNNVSLAQLSLGWVLGNQNVSSAIIGARSVQQLVDTVKGFQFYKKWNRELQDKINRIIDTTPDPKADFKQFKKGPMRRKVNFDLN